MSYSISISGHKDTQSREESEKVERDAANEARKLVKALKADGAMVTPYFSGGTIGVVDLNAED